MDKKKKLDIIKRKIEEENKDDPNMLGKIVFGEGSINAEIMFVGEAPGKQEAKIGRPFIGRSGRLLREEICRIGLQEQDVYITSGLKYLPKRGTPSVAQMSRSRPLFLEQIEVINPQVLVLLGKTAARVVLEEDIPIMKKHGSIYSWRGKMGLVTLHPAAAIRFPKYLSLLQSDFDLLKEYLDKKNSGAVR